MDTVVKLIPHMHKQADAHRIPTLEQETIWTSNNREKEIQKDTRHTGQTKLAKLHGQIIYRRGRPQKEPDLSLKPNSRNPFICSRPLAVGF